ncbi:MAG: SBBP repeat-containing protein [Bacteroidota bacterium]
MPGTKNKYSTGQSIVLDSSGNVYIAGDFEGTVDFDPGPDTMNLSSNGFKDAFVQKLDSNGHLLWVKQMGGILEDRASTLTADTDGNIYVTGVFRETVDFDPNSGITNLSSSGNKDIFIQKLDANGQLLWVKQLSGEGRKESYSTTLDAHGDLYTVGTYFLTVDFDPGPGIVNHSALSGDDTFILKLDADGNFIWIKNLGGSGCSLTAYSVNIDGSGNIYTAGGFSGSCDFDPAEPVRKKNSLGLDIFIHKLDMNGDFLWVKHIKGTREHRAKSITTDSHGNVYTTGEFRDTIDFDPGTDTHFLTTAHGHSKIFVQKLDPEGNFLWAKQLGGPSDDFANSITINPRGYVLSSGTFWGTADFDPGPGTHTLTSRGSRDIYLHKMDPNGHFKSVQQIRGTEYDLISSIITDSVGNIYATGAFGGIADLDPGEGKMNVASIGYHDAFVLKLSPCPLFATDIDEQASRNSLHIYPNPSRNGIFQIRSGQPIERIRLYDLSGRLLKNQDYPPLILNLQAYKSGWYVCQIQASSGQVIAKKIAIRK